MAKKILGLDIGTQSVKMALVSGGEVLDLAAETLPEGLMNHGAITNVQELAKFLKALARREKLRARTCAITLPAHQAFTLRLTMAEMTERQLLLNLPYEFHDYIDGTTDEYFCDYAVISRGASESGEPQLELLAACTKKSVVRAYEELCSRAGWTLATVVPTPVAYWKLLRRRGAQEGESADFCFADLGVSATRLYMYSHRSLEADRVVEVDPAHSKPDELHAQRSTEISRALNFYAYSNRRNQLGSVWLCGGGAMDVDTVAAIRGEINLETRSAAELMPPVRSHAELAPLCPAAVGAAL